MSRTRQGIDACLPGDLCRRDWAAAAAHIAMTGLRTGLTFTMPTAVESNEDLINAPADKRVE